MRLSTPLIPLLLGAFAFGGDYALELPRDSAAIPGLDFYIDHVWDARGEKSRIGIAKTGLFNIPENIVFQKTVPVELSDYFDRVAPNAVGKRPVSVEVQEISMYEQLGFTSETAIAQVQLAFKTRNGRIFNITSQKWSVSRWDATRLHAPNLAACLNMSLRKLSSMDTLQTSIRDGSPAQRSLYAPFRSGPENVLPDPPPRRTAVIASVSPGWKATSIGLQWMNYAENPGHWTFPSTMFLEVPTPRDKRLKSKGFMEFVPSIAAMRRTPSGPFAFLLQAGLPLGYESFQAPSGKIESGFFVGINSSQCIAYLPKEKPGMVVQAGPYQSLLLGSELYPYDLGIRIGIGGQF